MANTKNLTDEQMLNKLYQRYDRRMNNGQFDMAQATLDQINAIKPPET